MMLPSRPARRRPRQLQKVQLRFIDLGKKIGQRLARSSQQLADLTSSYRRKARRPSDTWSRRSLHRPLIPAEAARIEKALEETDDRPPERGGRDRECNAGPAVRGREDRGIPEDGSSRSPACRKQAADLREEIELLKLTRTVIAEYVIYLMQVVRSRLEGEVSRIISEITGGRYEQVLLDEDFNLLVRDIDNDYPIDRFSGGEQDDIAVALRIALSRYLAELHEVHESTFLIFDEIFGSQDEERRNNLLTALRTQESRFPQILLISHIAEMQGEFANTLVVEMGTDMVSRVREVGD